MRTYTLLFSIAAHVCAACAMLFTTVLATGEMPVPHDTSTFVNVVTALPPSVPPPAARPRVEPVVNPAAAPLEAPEGVHAEVERPLVIDTGEPVPDGVIGGLGTDAGIGLPSEPPPPPAAPVTPSRVGGDIRPPRKIADVAPVYPELARAARVSGVVIIEATIDEEGNVRDARVLRSIPLLDRAAVEAVRQWRFTPTVLNGQVIPIVMTVTVNFRLE
jgi:protein TonB